MLREKITHFDHERIPERIVHARGTGVHGFFELTESLDQYTTARVLTEVGEQTPVFARFSTVAGGAGSVDTPRDVRGFAVKLYTKEGNWDLVGNNIPVFFIQDAIKFPDIIHAVKMEPDRGFPQSASAHDTFWDFISLTPESMHMVMWIMSDRTIPRSLRMIEGFGVHSFRLVNADGESTFVKFHWRPKLGLQSTVWDEAVKIAGADPDFHRRDLYEAVESGAYPEWEFAVQLFTQEEADEFPFDHLDATKLIPEELVPLKVIGRMVLDRWPDNFFAETEQVAYCPGNIVPGIDFSNDPLLQGRLFSYIDTQLSRLGSANFHQLPINAPKCPFGNHQRDGHMQMTQPKGRVAYEPNSLAEDSPREAAVGGFVSAAVIETGEKGRIRAETFADHYSQARLFYLQPDAARAGASGLGARLRALQGGAPAHSRGDGGPPAARRRGPRKARRRRPRHGEAAQGAGCCRAGDRHGSLTGPAAHRQDEGHVRGPTGRHRRRRWLGRRRRPGDPDCRRGRGRDGQGHRAQGRRRQTGRRHAPGGRRPARRYAVGVLRRRCRDPLGGRRRAAAAARAPRSTSWATPSATSRRSPRTAAARHSSPPPVSSRTRASSPRRTSRASSPRPRRDSGTASPRCASSRDKTGRAARLARAARRVASSGH